MHEVIGTVADSYADYPCEPSVVENASNGDCAYTFKNQLQSDDKADDDLSSATDERDRKILRITAVWQSSLSFYEFCSVHLLTSVLHQSYVYYENII